MGCSLSKVIAYEKDLSNRDFVELAYLKSDLDFRIIDYSFYDLILSFPWNIKKVMHINISESICISPYPEITFSDFSLLDQFLISINILSLGILIILFTAIFILAIYVWTIENYKFCKVIIKFFF